MTPVSFPAPVGGYPEIVMAEHIESIERGDYYCEQCVLVLVSKRRISAGCTPERAAEMIRQATHQEDHK